MEYPILEYILRDMKDKEVQSGVASTDLPVGKSSVTDATLVCFACDSNGWLISPHPYLNPWALPIFSLPCPAEKGSDRAPDIQPRSTCHKFLFQIGNTLLWKTLQ